MERMTGLLGVAALVFIAWMASENRSRIRWRIVIGGLAMQMLIAYCLLALPPVVSAFNLLAAGVNRVISFADEGTTFLFGKLADPSGPWGFVFAIRVLPVIVFFAALTSVLYHVGVMQRLVAGLSWVMRRTLGVSATESLSAAANVFVGQTEAPLCIKPYIARMTRSQIMAVMTGGFATIAGSVLAAYVGLLGGADEASRILFAKHLITASVMSAPAGFVMAKLMVPETEVIREDKADVMTVDRPASNILDAAASGATDGARLALNVAAMLVAFVALLAMVNWPLTALGEIAAVKSACASIGIDSLSLQSVIGWVVRPLVWTFGVPWSDAKLVGGMLGEQVIATEFIAYLSLAREMELGTITPRGAQITTYLLCGFANFPSIAIQIGGLSTMAPERRRDFVNLGPRAMVAGAFACWCTGSVASLFIA